MTRLAFTPPDLGQLPRWERLLLEAEHDRLVPLPSGPVPVLDQWALDMGEHGLLHAAGVLEGDAELMTVPVLRVAPERPAVWLQGARWTQLGIPVLDEGREDFADRLRAGARWCETLRAELGRD